MAQKLDGSVLGPFLDSIMRSPVDQSVGSGYVCQTEAMMSYNACLVVPDAFMFSAGMESNYMARPLHRHSTARSTSSRDIVAHAASATSGGSGSVDSGAGVSNSSEPTNMYR